MTDVTPALASGERECEAMPGITDRIDQDGDKVSIDLFHDQRPRCVVVAVGRRDYIFVFLTERRRALAVYVANRGRAQVRRHEIPRFSGLASAEINFGSDGAVTVDGTRLVPAKWFQSD